MTLSCEVRKIIDHLCGYDFYYLNKDFGVERVKAEATSQILELVGEKDKEIERLKSLLGYNEKERIMCLAKGLNSPYDYTNKLLADRLKYREALEKILKIEQEFHKSDENYISLEVEGICKQCLKGEK